MNQKVPCKECGAMIMPATVAKTGGLCMRCYYRESGGVPPEKGGRIMESDNIVRRVNKMPTSANARVAMSLLEEVEEKIKEKLGDLVAISRFYTESESEQEEVWERAFFCEQMIKQCELAEKKSPQSEDVLILSNTLKARLYGCWQKAGTFDKAVEAYEKALALGGEEVTLRYNLAQLYSVKRGNIKKSIANFERIVELEGFNSELGIQAARELEKAKAERAQKIRRLWWVVPLDVIIFPIIVGIIGGLAGCIFGLFAGNADKGYNSGSTLGFLIGLLWGIYDLRKELS